MILENAYDPCAIQNPTNNYAIQQLTIEKTNS